MHVAAHGVYVSVDGEEGGMVCAAWELFDENWEGEVFGRGVSAVMMFLTNSCLSIFICSQEKELVDIHWSLLFWIVINNYITITS